MAKKDRGFTIIEVALVLAIAGLIFLVVFLALPALQRSQRDTARREDAGNIVSALQALAADNQGSLDSVSACSPDDTAPTGLCAYTGTLSQVTQITVDTGAPDEGTADITMGEKCDGTGTTRNAAVRVTLESGTDYCASM